MRGKLKCCDVSVVISGDTGTQRLLESGSLCVLGSSVSSGRSVVVSRPISIRPDLLKEEESKPVNLLRIKDAAPNVQQLWSTSGAQ